MCVCVCVRAYVCAHYACNLYMFFAAKVSYVRGKCNIDLAAYPFNCILALVPKTKQNRTIMQVFNV